MHRCLRMIYIIDQIHTYFYEFKLIFLCLNIQVQMLIKVFLDQYLMELICRKYSGLKRVQKALNNISIIPQDITIQCHKHKNNLQQCLLNVFLCKTFKLMKLLNNPHIINDQVLLTLYLLLYPLPYSLSFVNILLEKINRYLLNFLHQ